MIALTSLKAPISVNFEMTQVCNLQCGFCFSNSATHQHKSPPIERLIKIVDALAEAQVFQLSFFGGEFTTIPHWEDIVSHASHRGFFLGFVSNGTRLTRASAKCLAAHGATNGAVSLHGPEAIHDQIVGVPGAFRKAIAGIRECCEAGISINILFTPTKSNFTSLYETARWLKENDVPVVGIAVSRLCPSGEALNLWDELHLTLNDYKYLFKVMQTIRSDFAIPANMGDAFPLCVVPYKYWNLITGCWQSTGYGFISSTGDVRACTILPGSYGNILETPLTEIWSERLKEVRRLEHLPLRCKRCPFFCGGGCSASRKGAIHCAADEYIPQPQDENVFTFARWMPKLLYFLSRRALDRHNVSGRSAADERPLPPMTTKPQFNCRYGLRKDIGGYIGFFAGRGVLTFDDQAAHIVQLLDGQNSISDVVRAAESSLSSNSHHARESTLDLLRSLNRANLLTFH